MQLNNSFKIKLLILREKFPFKYISNLMDLAKWVHNGYESPSPHFVKQSVLRRNNLTNSTWIETGTYLGSTSLFLSKIAKTVVTIEPELNLYTLANKRFKNNPKVQVINGTSEEVLENVVQTMSGNLCFWLDGHFSAGVTFQGEKDTPIISELATIEKYLPKFENVVVLVDDIRCFNPNLSEYRTYPAIDVLVKWANSLNFSWTIEHDIFIAKNSSN